MSLKEVFASDIALAEIEEHLISAARRLYAYGFGHDLPRRAQLAGVGEIIRTATSWEGAVSEVKKWMRGQLEKLEKREKRDGKKRSWLVLAQGGEPEESLGGALERWISDEEYLPAEVPAGLDRLAALRRFWARFDGLYRYCAEMRNPMPLTAIDETSRKEGGTP